MNTLTLCLVAVLVASAYGEPPSGYSYPRQGGGGGGDGYIGGGGIGGGGGGGGYIQESVGYSTSEGASVDSDLLNKIRQILLREEAKYASSGGGGGGHGGSISSSYGAPSTQYGVPSTQYGVPGYVSRVVGIDLEGIRQAIQVAQYRQTTYGSTGGYSYPSSPSSSYGAPSSY